MRCFSVCSMFVLLIALIPPLFANDRWPADFEYLHPIPNSSLLSDSTTIITRLYDDGELQDPTDVQFQVTGSKSGSHSGETLLSRSTQTFIFKPDRIFATAESVFVNIQVPALDINYDFSFTTSLRPSSATLRAAHAYTQLESHPEERSTPGGIINGVAVPPGFPQFRPSINIDPSPGKLFVTGWNWLMIFENDGTPYFFRRSNSHVWDFTVQPNGLISYMDGATAKVMNQHFEIIKSYKCRHGYATDPHEFVMLPNGHVLLIAQDTQIFDLSEIVEGGKPAANVVGTHIQELDADKNVIFEWRCWDYYDILDAIHEPLRSQTIHAVHMNSIDVDYDSNLVISSRHLDEVTKIDRRTGEIIWRLGGVNNQFTFINETEPFNYQHDVRAVPGKPNHYTLLDNGNHHDPPYSRAVEYRVEESSKTALKVWEYRHQPKRFTHWMGSVQRLPSGNTHIGWAHQKLPKVTEVTPEGQIVYEADFVYPETGYRSHRFEWSGCAKTPSLFVERKPHKVILLFTQFGDCPIEAYNIYADTTQLPTTRIASTSQPFLELDDLSGPQTYYFRVTSVDSSGNESDFSNQISAFVKSVTPDSNLLTNGDFSLGMQGWQVSTQQENMSTVSVNQKGQLHVEIAYSGDSPTDVTVSQPRIPLYELKTYQLEFEAYASANRPLLVQLTDSLGHTDYSMLGLVGLSRRPEQFKFQFLMEDYTDQAAQLQFALAHQAGDVYIDNVVLKEVKDTRVVKDTVEPPNQFRVIPNYPNPFNAQTTVRYELPDAAAVDIRIVDTLGRVVTHQHVGLKEAGSHEFQWNAENQPSGLYFCSIRVNDSQGKPLDSKTLKLILMK